MGKPVRRWGGVSVLLAVIALVSVPCCKSRGDKTKPDPTTQADSQPNDTTKAKQTEDSPEARAKAADRYLKVCQLDKMIKDMTTEMAKTLPEQNREGFTKLMLDEIDWKELEKVMKDALVRIFTAAELHALADFYGSKEGQSILGKMGKFMGDCMPAIQQQIGRAANAARARQSRP
jgi:hypothetical protein